ncbi:LIM domain only protein 7 [Merluccius polli]|uniref:LIM domain only protein 7 n=1 Tax=Merluccius polli TaxID=89951 RepID=A0AA47P3K1_MERPO|nr:LIM domain only protein 7 [Merluccius polli]
MPSVITSDRRAGNDNRSGMAAGPSDASGEGQASRSDSPAPGLQWACEYGSGSDSDAERPDPDLVLDDLASRRFHSPSPAPPTNFAMPISPAVGRGAATAAKAAAGPGGDPCDVQVQEVVSSSSGGGSNSRLASVRVDQRRPLSADSLFRDRYGNSDEEDEDDEVGYADPVQDDLYSRKVGLAGQPAGNTPYDKFLPKFWTPEEDAHIQKIKLGSQRRPWYRKMQGFSPKKSGSSSDDSDSDVNPWLSSRHSPFGSSPSHSHTPDASTSTTHVVGKSPHPPPHTSPPPPKIQLPYTECTPPVYARMDPTSGPKLVKCVRRPLLGRQDPREPPDPVDYESIAPDLSNDDMFSRRTQAFQSNTQLAMLKTQLSPSRTRRHLFSSQPELNIVTQAHVHRGRGAGAMAAATAAAPATEPEESYPDIEQDDVVFRMASLEQARRQRPLSGAPDNYAPMPVPEPWALPPDLQARLLCPPCPLSHREATHRRDRAAIGKKADPVADDMVARKLAACSEGGGAPRSLSVPSVPAACSEGDLRKWRSIRESGQLRFKKRLMVERLAAMRM